MKMNLETLANQIKQWGNELGFQQVGICDVDLQQHEQHLQSWLTQQYHGEMQWMERHGMMRARPQELHPGSLRVISVRLDYLPSQAQFASNLEETNDAYISRYALGRDYHKLMRNKLKQLGEKIKLYFSETDYRPFVDSAPILERPLAAKAGLGWVGKHSLLLNKQAGSWFFLGELLINIPLPVDQPTQDLCGNCVACKTMCPTGAIVDDKIIDARRCISYLTIEYDGVIPIELRKAMGNRIYGCDDCQLVCPWNRHSSLTQQTDFYRRDIFNDCSLLTLLSWNEDKFLQAMQGSAIRRIGFRQWRRNLIVAIGNAPYKHDYLDALKKLQGIDELWDEHIKWAQEQLLMQLPNSNRNTKRLIRIVQKGLPRDA